MTKPLPEGFPSAEEIVSQYIKLRDHVAELKKKHTAELAPFAESMTVLEGAANMLLMATGQKALSTNAGTAFPKVILSVKTEDPDEFMTFVIEGRYERAALTAHVKKEFVETWMEEHEGNPPPGIEIDKVRRIEFRKA